MSRRIQAVKVDSFFASRYMPLLSETIRYLRTANSLPLQGLKIILAQHLVPTILPLFEALVECGAKPEDIYALGKIYSTNPEVVQELKRLGVNLRLSARTQMGDYEKDLKLGASYLWQELFNSTQGQFEPQGILVLDHGGFLRQTLPPQLLGKYPIVAVEHTAKGFFADSANIVPVIDMARSRAKKLLEPDAIVSQALNALREWESNYSGAKIGIIGCGSIGRALLEQLRREHISCSFFDIDPLSSKSGCRVKSTTALINQSDIIFGCTGRDIAREVNWSSITGNKTFLSLSSGDIEFASLLKRSSERGCGLETIYLSTDETEIRIPYGGFPCNFAFAVKGDTGERIQITRSLTLLSTVQAAVLLRRNLAIEISPADEKFLFLHAATCD